MPSVSAAFCTGLDENLADESHQYGDHEQRADRKSGRARRLRSFAMFGGGEQLLVRQRSENNRPSAYPMISSTASGDRRGFAAMPSPRAG